MPIAQGKTIKGRYFWQCNNNIPNHRQCPYCLGGDVQRLLKNMTISKGQIYYANIKAYLSLRGHAIYLDAKAIVKKDGRLTLKQVLELMDHYQFPRSRAKVFFEWLEENCILPAGKYESLKSRGFQPTKA